VPCCFCAVCVCSPTNRSPVARFCVPAVLALLQPAAAEPGSSKGARWRSGSWFWRQHQGGAPESKSKATNAAKDRCTSHSREMSTLRVLQPYPAADHVKNWPPAWARLPVCSAHTRPNRAWLSQGGAWLGCMELGQQAWFSVALPKAALGRVGQALCSVQYPGVLPLVPP
jgi:hypothetical protein